MIEISAETWKKHIHWTLVKKIINLTKEWIKMYDIGINLVIKNIYDSVIVEIKVLNNTKYPTKQQIRKYNGHAPELVSGEKGK